MYSKLGGRKVFFGIVLINIAVSLEVFADGGLSETMSMFLLAIGGSYFLSNSAVHAVRARQSGAAQTKELAQKSATDSSEILASLEELKVVMQDAAHVDSKKGLADLKTQLSSIRNQNAIVVKGIQELITYVNQVSRQ